MDCNYIRQNDIHDKYVLNRLSAAEKAEYEKHLEDCASCKEELQKQTEIIKGIQKVGLQEMKNEIQRQVMDVNAKKKTPDWQMILKVAAVVFIIAIIPGAIYYFQTEPGKPISQLIKPKDSKPENESFSYDEMQVENKSETREKTIEPSPKNSVSLEEPAKLEKQDALRTDKDQLAISSGTASGGAGRGYAATEKQIEAMPDLERKLEKEEEAKVEQPKSRMVAKEGKDELTQKFAEGIIFNFVGSDIEKEKTNYLKSQEMPTTQQYDGVTSKKLTPENNLMKKGIGSVDSKPPISNAVYKSGEKRISINFILAGRELKINKESKLPRCFKVQIFKIDSLNWTMNWYVNKEFLEYDPYQIKIVVNNSKLYTIILDAYIYEIDTSVDSSKAILAR
jgi:hypothetical protein